MNQVKVDDLNRPSSVNPPHEADPPHVANARLVARRDLQKEGLDYDHTFAPVIQFVSLRIILTYAASKIMVVKHWDIVSVFLHGPIDLEIYMQQPQAHTDGTNRVCKLKTPELL